MEQPAAASSSSSERTFSDGDSVVAALGLENFRQHGEALVDCLSLSTYKVKALTPAVSPGHHAAPGGPVNR